MRAELHPSEHLLIDFLLGKVPDAEQSAVEAHLAECVACQEWAATLYPADTFVELLAAARTHNDLSRATAATPSLSPLSTPTLAWQAPELPVAIPRDLPPVLANHPKYDPVQFLGAGGMGSVWLAKHTVMNRQVAVKVIRPDLSARPQAASRFIREIQAAGMLKCDYIVTAYDAEEIDGSCLLVMEYVPGQNLAEVLRSGPLPVSEACRAARDAAQGLAHAHAAGYVHRDVKPSNLIRTPEGITKVLDFGLVTAEVEGSSQLSAENMVIGTPDYIAPEQIEQPQTADARSDVYSLGCTLYHLLSGSTPYPVNSAIKKLDAHRDPAMLPAPLTGVPPELAAVVTKMLAKKPGDRFPCAMDVAAALEPFVSGAVDGTRVLAPKRAVAGRSSTRWLIAAGLLFAVAGLLAGGVVYKIQYDNTAITLETDDRDIEVVMKRNGELVRIVDTKTKQAWNLDTKKLRLKADGSELSIDLPGREPLVLRRNGNVAVTIRRQAGAPGLPASRMTEGILPLKDGECHVFRGHTDGLLALAVSPDGKYTVTGGSYPESKDSALRLWNLHTGEEVRQFQGHTSLIYSVAFSPDGKKVLSASGDGTARLWDVERGIEIGTLSDVKPRGAKYGVAFSPDGERAIATSQRPLLYDVASRKELALFEEYTVGQVRSAFLSPDGTTLATGDSNGDGSYEVVTLWDMKSGKRIGSLDEHKWLMYALAWSPEGTRLASASHDSTVRVWDPNTGRSVLQLVHPRPVYGVAYSPGGRFLVTGCHDHTVRIWDARTGKELVKFLHDLEVWHVAFTPDGKHALSVSLDKTMRMWKLPESLVDPRVSATSPAPKPGNKVAKAKLPLRNPRPSGHLAVTDFREIHGVTGAGLKEWFDRLPAGFYPARVTSRAGATPPLFDAVAVRDGRNPTFEAHLALEIKNSQSDFDVMSRSGWALQNSCPYPKDGQILRHHIWILQDGNRWYSYGVLLGSLPESLKRWKRDGLKPKGCALSGPEVGKGVATRHFSILLEPDQGQTWEFFAELSDAELVAELAAARKNGRRPDFVSSLGTDKDRTYSLSVVPNADNLAWHFEGKMSEKRFEAMLAEQKKLGRRPMNVMSEVRGNAIEYTAVWIQYSPAQ